MGIFFLTRIFVLYLIQFGNACQDVEQCLSFLFYRNSINCILVDHSVNERDMEDCDEANYYEIKVILTM